MSLDIKKMRAKINVHKGSRKPKSIDINCEYDGDDIVCVHFERIEHSHKRAVLIKFSSDVKEWVPFSQIRDVDVDDKVLICSEWIAAEKGLDCE